MILGDVEETITTVEIDDETYEEIIKVGRHPCSCLMMHMVITPLTWAAGQLPSEFGEHSQSLSCTDGYFEQIQSYSGDGMH